MFAKAIAEQIWCVHLCADAATMNVKTNEKNYIYIPIYKKKGARKKKSNEKIFLLKKVYVRQNEEWNECAHTKPEVFIIHAIAAASQSLLLLLTTLPHILFTPFICGVTQANADENYKVTIRHKHRERTDGEKKKSL